MSDCIFCKIAAGEAPSYKVLESDSAFAFLDINPVSEYHTLVIPKTHYRDIFDIPRRELEGVMRLLKEVVELYEHKAGVQNLQIINNNGSEAQQDVFHIHFHIVPRKAGDGQDVKWKTNPEMREQFDEMLKRIS